jgi:hypothetical protein
MYPGVEVFVNLEGTTPNKIRAIVRDLNTESILVCADRRDGSGCEWYFADEVIRIPKRKKPKGWLTYSPTFGVIFTRR